MKLNYLIALIVAGIVGGCTTKEPDFFVDTHFIKFRFDDKKEYYRIDYNFSMQASESTTEHKIAVPVEFMGRDLVRDLTFGIGVDKELTTLASDCYDLKQEQTFRAGIGKIDTMWVKLLRKPSLKEGEKLLRLRLAETADFQLYMPDSLFVEIHVSDVFSRPVWWNESVTNAYLGAYTKLKYDEFVKETGIRDFGILEASEKRHYTIIFKRALEKTPRMDENGQLMSVTIPG